MKRTKIVCTLGPATSTLERITALIEEGADMMRINFSHGLYEEHLERIKLVRLASEIVNRPIGILQDLQGPKIRIGDLAKTILLNPGEKLTITTDDIVGDFDRISTTYKEIVNDVKLGDTILMDDGRIELQVLSKTETEVVTEVIIGGLLKPRKGINLPGVNISIPSLTEKDIRDLEFGLKNNVDMVALSFVRTVDDIRRIKQIIREKGKNTWVIAKIEKPEAIENLDAIILEADGIMVARGDLGVEMKTHEVPVLQKVIVEKCNMLNKPVIIATQMLESMIENPRPTRAEANDVANAVFDGTDAVMLSGETAVGEYPVQAVDIMSDIIERVEKHGLKDIPARKKHFLGHDTQIKCIDLDEAIAASAVQISEALCAKVIIALTHTGATAIKVSKQKPKCNIVAVTDNEVVQRRLSLVWGIQTTVIETLRSTDNSFKLMEYILMENQLVEEGDIVIYTLGIPIGAHGITDTIKVARIGSALIC
jgi:pyruvate kinase